MLQAHENNIILARNFWKYLTREEMINASWKLVDKADKNMLFVMGQFDHEKDGSIPFFLRNLGFDSRENDANENLLYFDKTKMNYPLIKTKDTWKGYVGVNYGKYIPSYIR